MFNPGYIIEPRTNDYVEFSMNETPEVATYELVRTILVTRSNIVDTISDHFPISLPIYVQDKPCQGRSRPPHWLPIALTSTRKSDDRLQLTNRQCIVMRVNRQRSTAAFCSLV